ncbi:MAG: hypothetical protein F6K41_25545 [Symploca sp. SIO3E6]|nr:hypothetical protein [Caldora sp. SIO3E6]
MQQTFTSQSFTFCLLPSLRQRLCRTALCLLLYIVGANPTKKQLIRQFIQENE